MEFDSVEEALEALKNGDSIIVVGDENHENEDDLIAVTQWMKGDTINYMAKEARGLIRVPISSQIAERLNLKTMVNGNTDDYGTNFTVSIDHISTITGISMFDHIAAAKALISPDSKPESFHKPEHLFPLVFKEKGALIRLGHTEAAVDLAKSISAVSAGVICEMMNDDGMTAKGNELQQFKERHQLEMITTESLISYRRKQESKDIELKAAVRMSTDISSSKMYGFQSQYAHEDIVVLGKGEPRIAEDVKLYSACLTGDIFHSQRCDCDTQLEALMKCMNGHGGLIIYLPQEGRGTGLMDKLKAYELTEQGHDMAIANLTLSFDEDLRDYHIAVQILEHFNVQQVNLLNNSPKKSEGLEDYDIKAAERTEVIVPETEHNYHHMETEKPKMGHLI